jgi:uncharacterized damage-inducible protein DinB
MVAALSQRPRDTMIYMGRRRSGAAMAARPRARRAVPRESPTLESALVGAWRLNDRVTRFLVENLPDAILDSAVPGAPRRTVRMIAGHLHNARCMWVTMLGRKHGIEPPASVDRRRVGRRALVAALRRSAAAIEALLRLGIARGGKVPGFTGDAATFLAYFVAHEAHHRGQIVMIARQLGRRLPASVTTGLWIWPQRAREH